MSVVLHKNDVEARLGCEVAEEDIPQKFTYRKNFLRAFPEGKLFTSSPNWFQSLALKNRSFMDFFDSFQNMYKTASMGKLDAVQASR